MLVGKSLTGSLLAFLSLSLEGTLGWRGAECDQVLAVWSTLASSPETQGSSSKRSASMSSVAGISKSKSNEEVGEATLQELPFGFCFMVFAGAKRHRLR